MFQLVTGSCVEREALKFARCQGWHQHETLAKFGDFCISDKKIEISTSGGVEPESEQQFNKRTYGE